MTKATVPELSKCYQCRCIGIETINKREVFVMAENDDDLVSVVKSLCGEDFKVDMDGVKNVTVFGTKDTVAEIKKTNNKKEGRSTLYRSQ